MKKFFSLLYGVMAYVIFFCTILYTIGFVGNFIVPKSIDSAPKSSLVLAILIDVLLLLLFAFQHSIMARPAFKEWLTEIIPKHLQRSTYVLVASLCLVLLMWQWQPIGGIIWYIGNETINTVLLVINLSGWGIVFI